MEIEIEYGVVIVCDKCEQGCSINGYGDWIDGTGEYEHLCLRCYEEFKETPN